MAEPCGTNFCSRAQRSIFIVTFLLHHGNPGPGAAQRSEQPRRKRNEVRPWGAPAREGWLAGGRAGGQTGRLVLRCRGCEADGRASTRPARDFFLKARPQRRGRARARPCDRHRAAPRPAPCAARRGLCPWAEPLAPAATAAATNAKFHHRPDLWPRTPPYIPRPFPREGWLAAKWWPEDRRGGPAGEGAVPIGKTRQWLADPFPRPAALTAFDSFCQTHSINKTSRRDASGPLQVHFPQFLRSWRLNEDEK